MSYMALYRKFRPQEFYDVKGQDPIVTTLKNQIEADRVGHAYLFCGTRGTGKTTVAKIFAKAVNCEAPENGSPCGQCSSCKSIQEGSSMNVIEIDAASNNGVENIREIRDEVAYSPTSGKYKVYIIDEVHMLSIGAFNALLKTLEEPPSYVIFILATTEAHKIPVTILSRCQRYDFKRISISTIEDRLRDLITQEGVEAEDMAISFIARSADGALRDALSLLDQCIAFYLGQKLTYEHVLTVLGAVDTEVFSHLLRKIMEQDVTGVIIAVEQLVIEGRELGQFVNDFTWYLRNLMLLKSSPNMENTIDISAENKLRLIEEGERITDEMLIRYIHLFSELSNQIRFASQKRILIEITLVKLCRPQMESDTAALAARIEQMEKKLEAGVFTTNETNHLAQNQNRRANPALEKEKPKLEKAIPEEIEKIVKSIGSIASRLPGLSKGYLKKANFSLGNENELIVFFEDHMAASFFMREDVKQEFDQVVEDFVGKKVEIVIKTNQNGQKFEDNYVDISQVIHMDITYEEE